MYVVLTVGTITGTGHIYPVSTVEVGLFIIFVVLTRTMLAIVIGERNVENTNMFAVGRGNGLLSSRRMRVRDATL